MTNDVVTTFLKNTADDRTHPTQRTGLDSAHEGGEGSLDRSDVALIRQGSVNVTSKVCWHLRTGLANDKDVSLSL